MYAALGALPIPDDVVARLFHGASLLREHRGDGHIAALIIEGVGGLEAHVLLALDMGMPPEKFGRIHHLPAAQLAAVIDGVRDRGLIGDDGWLNEQGRAARERVEALTDDLAAKPYEASTRASSMSSWPRSSRSPRDCSPRRTHRRNSGSTVRYTSGGGLAHDMIVHGVTARNAGCGTHPDGRR